MTYKSACQGKYFQMSFSDSRVSKKQLAILVRINNDWTIGVQASIGFLEQNGMTRRYLIETDVSSQNRLLKKEKSSYMVCLFT